MGFKTKKSLDTFSLLRKENSLILILGFDLLSCSLRTTFSTVGYVFNGRLRFLFGLLELFVFENLNYKSSRYFFQCLKSGHNKSR